MLTIAVSSRDPMLVEYVNRGFPDAHLVLAALQELAETAAELRLFGVVVGPRALRGQAVVELAMLKARYPELPVIVVLPLTARLHRHLLELGRAQVDTVIHEFEDHPASIRERFNRASMVAVAQVIAHSCPRSVPTLVTQNVLRAVNQVRQIRSLSAFAAALRRPLRALEREFNAADLPSPRIMLPWIRLLAGSRLLCDMRMNAERLARAVGYHSARAVLNAFHRLMGTTPSEVRAGGGLWFASARFRQALAGARTPPG